LNQRPFIWITSLGESDLSTYLTTDQQALGILSWASVLITVFGFVIAIWQILKVKSAAVAAGTAVRGLTRRVHSQELLVQLSSAHTHLEAARNRIAGGSREMGLHCLELSTGAVIGARAASRDIPDVTTNLQSLLVRLGRSTEQLSQMIEPVVADLGLLQLQLDLRETSQDLQEILAQLRYTYRVDEDKNGNDA
jgi:hypothetical protein